MDKEAHTMDREALVAMVKVLLKSDKIKDANDCAIILRVAFDTNQNVVINILDDQSASDSDSASTKSTT